MRDFQKIMKEPPQGVSASPVDMNIFQWQAVMFGPEDTAWEGGTFNLLIDFTEEYPNTPPTVRFVTKIFHPNVYNDGRICIDILKSQWSPIYDTSAILLSIQSLLNDPNPASPANEEAAKLFQNDRREYSRRIRILVQENTAQTAAASAAQAGASKD
jgi:ubiquitin-conjugating enzyme E2 A